MPRVPGQKGPLSRNLLTLPGLAKAAASGGCLRCCSPPGRFGELCCGCLQLPGRQELPVAVHTLREGCSDSQRLSFLAEALTLGQFDHSHVVRLEGVVTRGRAGAPPAWVGGGVGEESVVWEVGCATPPGPLCSVLGGRPDVAQHGERSSALHH